MINPHNWQRFARAQFNFLRIMRGGRTCALHRRRYRYWAKIYLKLVEKIIQ